MASFSLVHGAWGGGWCWDLVRAELEPRGHIVHTPDLPCEDVAAGVEEYAAAVPAADVVVGYSLGGFTIPHVEADTHVFLTALVAGTGERPAYIVCTQDAVIRPAWQRHLARDVLGVEPLELEAGHSPMLERPRELAMLLEALV